MTTQHTQGRLIARMPSDELHAIRDIRGRIVADVGYSETAERDMANARRLVAAWNACEGISTEALETEGSAAMGWTRTASKLIHATKQRDDLLEALTRCITAIERTDHYTDADRSAAADMLRRQHEAIKVLREALGDIAAFYPNSQATDWAKQALKDTEELA